MLTSAFAWVVLVGLTFAPFPPEHQYNFLNPVIDPWWAVTKKETQLNKSMDISLKSIGTSGSKITLLAQVAQAEQEHAIGSV